MHEQRLRIYHDGDCPICQAEMEELVRADRDARLELIDVAAADFDDPIAADAGLDADMLKSALYVYDESGAWHSGPDAFAEIYQRVGIDRVAALWASRPLRPLVHLGYRLFLVTRPLLAALGFDRLVRWWVRREADAAAARATHCSSDSR